MREDELEQIGSVTSLLRNENILRIVDAHDIIKGLKKKNAYNLFNLSTYTSHLENFHSDVIASLLDVNGLHDQGNLFLMLFIEFLNRDYHCKLQMKDFTDAQVLREKGRIDIWIRNEAKGKAILIENKMNNAGDREGQIDDYHEYSETRGNCKVEAIVYLSLDGLKPTPAIGANLEKLICNIGAFTNTKGDLISGWLQPCLNASLNNKDTSSLLNQYIKLIHHLASKQMDNNTLNEFYDFINQNHASKAINTLIELNRLIPKYRTDKFVKQITDIKPFKSSFRWKDNHILYDFFRQDQNSFKMDIHFMDDIGNASVLFWNPPLTNEIGLSALTKKLKDIDMLSEFEIYEPYNYAKFFQLYKPYKTLEEVDKAIVDFVKKFMLRLEKSSSSN